ncbi:STAS-like domain-containing protein [Pantoea sp. AS142]|uniref:STAS-like domain-containing protein n=1 Tax=Pantoea sp. AS142 TaxID=3081292 RepID=UPI00301A9B28
MNSLTLKIGERFSQTPSGRFYTDMTKSSGEEFREEVLLPLLRSLNNNQKIDIVLDDDVEGYGSSFLVEGFAGIIKYGYMTREELINKINVIYSDPDFKLFKEKIFEYINKAAYKSKPYISTKPEYERLISGE